MSPLGGGAARAAAPDAHRFARSSASAQSRSAQFAPGGLAGVVVVALGAFSSPVDRFTMTSKIPARGARQLLRSKRVPT